MPCHPQVSTSTKFVDDDLSSLLIRQVACLSFLLSQCHVGVSGCYDASSVDNFEQQSFDEFASRWNSGRCLADQESLSEEIHLRFISKQALTNTPLAKAQCSSTSFDHKRRDPAPRYVGGKQQLLTLELLDEIREFTEEERGPITMRIEAILFTLSRTYSRTAILSDAYRAPSGAPSHP